LVTRRITSDDVIDELFKLLFFRAMPEHIASDSGPECTAQAIRRWPNRLRVKILFIEPGSSWENGHIESFNGRLRDELHNREALCTSVEAKVLIAQWRKEYNQVCPHSSLHYGTPAPEAGISAILT
jgi:transposase InsO family protein